ncbi:MAG: hypothetical protein ABF636_03040 [Acetobacter sp.]
MQADLAKTGGFLRPKCPLGFARIFVKYWNIRKSYRAIYLSKTTYSVLDQGMPEGLRRNGVGPHFCI